MKKINCMIFAFIIILFIFNGCAFKASEDARIIFIMEGGEITHSDGKKEPAALKMLVRKGDTIKTGSGFIMLQIGDDILTRIEPNSTVQMAKLFEGEETRLALDDGQIISRIKKLRRNSFIIKTPTATASVRGTQYSVSYYKNRSVLAVKEGRVQIDIKEKSGEKQKMVEAGNTMVINKDQMRSINEFEALEIDKLSQIPYSTERELKGDDAYKDVARIAEEQEQMLYKEIVAKGGPIPKTHREMLKKFGYINRVNLYNNKYYTGIIISRGRDVLIMTLDGIESVPAKQIRNVKRARNVEE
ncbi:MAG: FecR family protein [Spirochaetota bacterium]